ncbi:MAG: hypothetical protein U1A77_22105 [Pirellulales bacterium]
MKWTVTLRASATAIRPPRAWWLPTLDSERVAAELTELPLKQTALRLLFAADGVLVIPSASDVAEISVQSIGGVALGCAANRVYLPVDAQLVPQLSDEQLEALLPDEESLYLWRPGHGVVRFARSELKCLEDLVNLPQPLLFGTEPLRWDSAKIGAVLPGQLIEISLLQQFDLTLIFGGAESEIGAASNRWDLMPPSPYETTPAQLARTWWKPLLPVIVVAGIFASVLFVLLAWCPLAWRLAIVAIVFLAILLFERSFYFDRTRALWERVIQAVRNWLDRRPAPSPQSPARAASSIARGHGVGYWGGMSAKFRGWLDQRRQELSNQLDALRHREVERLLNLLEQRPDEGLKYALPLTGQHQPRGLAPPGARLAPRAPDFSLQGLGGTGGPADVWQLTAQYRSRLRQKYLDLANREIQLGRRRRAAYILAELLGDLRAAATTLADGGHYREAATLYSQRLGDMSSAASCLVRGGLLVDAIAIYEKLARFETIAELYEKLDRPDDAARAYRMVVSSRLSAGDFKGAAHLLETKLQAPDEALNTLRLGWPDSVQAESCLRETYRLWGQLGRHAQAQLYHDSLFAEHAHSLQGLVLARVLAEVAHKYPDHATRSAAADRVRRIAAKRLGAANAVERQGLLETVASLDPSDRLLGRDCQRFRRRAATSPSLAAPQHTSPSTPVWIARTISLPEADWRTIIAWGGVIYVAGWRDQELMLVRTLPDRTFVQLSRPQSWKLTHVEGREVLLVGGDVQRSPLLVHCLGSRPLQIHGEFPEADRLQRRNISGVSGAHVNLVYCHLDEHGLLHYVRDLPLGIVVERYLPDQLHSFWSTDRPTLILDEGELTVTAPPSEPQWLIANNFLFHGSGRRLLAWNMEFNQSSPREFLFQKNITGLQASRLGSTKMLAVSLESGGELFEISQEFQRISRFGASLHSPRTCFSDNGRLFAADEQFLECFDIKDSGRLTFVGSTPRQREPPAAMCCLPNNSQVATLDGDGKITIYESR